MSLLALALTTAALAQEPVPPPDEPDDDHRPRTLFGDDVHSGGYGGPIFGVGVLDGQVGFTSGGRGGWVVNHVIVIGGYGMNTMVVDESGEELRVSGGGMFFEGILGYKAPVHGTVEVGLGFGSTAVGKKETPAFQPFGAVRLELNLTDWMRFTVGPSVRYSAAQSATLPGAAAPLSYGGETVLKFGWF